MDGHEVVAGLECHLMTIETARLRLRELQEADLCSLAGTINNPRIARNLTRVPWPYDLNDARAFYEHALALPPQSAVFVITDRSSPDRLLGAISYEGVPDPELGYWLDEPYWEKGNYYRSGPISSVARIHGQPGRKSVVPVHAGERAVPPHSGRSRLQACGCKLFVLERSRARCDLSEL
jgi:hypothetical protein